MKIEIFETTAGCGYKEKAILLKVAPLQFLAEFFIDHKFEA